MDGGQDDVFSRKGGTGVGEGFDGGQCLFVFLIFAVDPSSQLSGSY